MASDLLTPCLPGKVRPFRIFAVPQTLLCPACLYGTANAVRSGWRSLWRRIYRARNWPLVMRDEEIRPFNSKPDDILLMHFTNMAARGRETLWRPYRIGEDLRMALADCDETDLEQLVLNGMRDYMWFSLGMLLVADTWFKCDRALPELIEDVYRPMLRAFVYWLPEFVYLSSRIVSVFNRELTQQVAPLAWASGIFVLVHRVFNKAIELEEVTNRYGGSVVAALLESSIIRDSNHRYFMRE